MRRVWDKLSGEDPNPHNSFNVIEQQFVSQSEKNSKSGVVTAKGDPPGAGNTKDSGSKTTSKESGNKTESGVLIANEVSPGARNTMDSWSKTQAPKIVKTCITWSLTKGKMGENHPKVWRIVLRM